MPTAKYGLTSSVVNGKIYVIGEYKGSYGEDDDFSIVEEYDPATDVWTTKTSKPTVILGLTSSVVNGRIYVIGGSVNNDNISSIVEEYDPATDVWTTKTSKPIVKLGLTSSVVNGRIYTIGGNLIGAIEEYDPATGIWTN